MNKLIHFFVLLVSYFYRVKKLSAILLFLAFAYTSFSQTDSLIWISGSVVDSASSKPVPFANIASYSSHLLFAADSLGHFALQLPIHDSIKIFVLGYGIKIFKLDSVFNGEEETILFPVSQTSIMLKNININLQRGFIDADEKITSVGIMENLNLPSDIIPYDKSKDLIPASYKPVFKSKPPVAALFFHPVSYINYFASKNEKSKRKMVELLSYHQNDSLLTNDLIREVSGLSDNFLEEFIIFCNKNIKVNPQDDIYTIRKKIFFAFEKYLKRKN